MFESNILWETHSSLLKFTIKLTEVHRSSWKLTEIYRNSAELTGLLTETYRNLPGYLPKLTGIYRVIYRNLPEFTGLFTETYQNLPGYLPEAHKSLPQSSGEFTEN